MINMLWARVLYLKSSLMGLLSSSRQMRMNDLGSRDCDSEMSM